MNDQPALRPGVSLVLSFTQHNATIVALLTGMVNALQVRGSDYEVLLFDSSAGAAARSAVSDPLLQGFTVVAGTSWLDGAAQARYATTVAIDDGFAGSADRLMTLIDSLPNQDHDVLVTRTEHGASAPRRLLSRIRTAVSGRLVSGTASDLQAGATICRTHAVQHLRLRTLPSVQRVEFRRVAKDAGLAVKTVTVRAQPAAVRYRQRGMAGAIYAYLTQPRAVVPFVRSNNPASLDGFHYKGKAYTPHNTIPLTETAMRRMSAGQLIVIGLLALYAVAGFIFNWHIMLAGLIVLLTLLYFSDFIFNLYLVTQSFFFYRETDIDESRLQAKIDWPRYTVFCPLYKEAAILPQFTKAMIELDYPKDKLEVMLLLEANDTETIAAAEAMRLPKFIRIVVVPHSMPKTKPKACNYGLRQATGEYAVIYDAEDIPDPQQLKKAVLAFRDAPAEVGCIQAKLNYYNWNQNLLTRLFTLEYSLWYDLVLPGLQSIKAPIPLGGTSNHFRVADLRSFGGWDPFNVTEDADLGMRLAKRGYSTRILDSVTLEEANSQYGNWLRQRSRWVKGYIQTYFVHTRRMAARQSRRDFAIFQLVIGGKVLAALVNPLLWVLTVLYFTNYGIVGQFIHSLYGGWVFYLGLITLVFGNFLYMYYYMMGALKRNHGELAIFALAVPLYWLMMSVATFMALREFIIKPFHWQKTVHGLHLKAKPVATSQAGTA